MKMIRKAFMLLLVFFLGENGVFSQKIYTHAIGLQSENDSYLLTGKDGYYTNGLTLRYNWTKRDTSSTTIHGIEIGQYMYNAKNGSYKELERIDRPVTAYLFARYNQTLFQKRNVWQWNIGVGTIGPNALGRQMQEGIHSMLGMYKPQEWQFQLRNALSVDGSLLFAPNWIKAGKSIRLDPIFHSNVGLTFDNLKSGILFRWGRILQNSQSTYWNASLNKTDKAIVESYFYTYPSIQYNVYNATVQGGLWTDDIHRQPLNRFLYTQKLGWQYAKNRVQLDLSINYSSKESKKQRFSQLWGNIKIFYNVY